MIAVINNKHTLIYWHLFCVDSFTHSLLLIQAALKSDNLSPMNTTAHLLDTDAAFWLISFSLITWWWGKKRMKAGFNRAIFLLAAQTPPCNSVAVIASAVVRNEIKQSSLNLLIRDPLITTSSHHEEPSEALLRLPFFSSCINFHKTQILRLSD